jgi:hypothetical protein
MALTRVINSGIGVAASIAGEATASTNLQQGLAKMWANVDGTGTAALDDSFNASGLTDNGTGDFTVAINNDMSNADYSCQFNGNSAHVGLNAIATGSLQVFVTAANDSSQDVDPVTYTAFGDLA